MKRCFGYTRVSTAKQGEGVSLEAQKEAISAFAETNDITITKWFEEKETAAKRGRPIFNAMLRQLRGGKADGLVIHKIDRSARNFADWAKIGDLADAGIDVYFASESLDFRSRGGRLSADIQAVIAADYIRNLREECMKGIHGRLKQGLYPFNAPIGYLNNGGGKPKTIDPVRGPLVAQMFELYASGEYPIWGLVTEMKNRDLTTSAGRPLSKTGVENTLNNLFYTGIIKIKRTGQVYKGIHEPLISAALFERVQEVKAGKCGKKITKHNHTFRGLFRCGLCDTAMIPERQKGYVYYRCQTRSCPTKTVREERIEEAVHNLLNTHKLSDLDIDTIDQNLRAWFDEREKQQPQDTSHLNLAKVDERLDTLADKLIDRVIDDETYQSKKEKLLLQRKSIEDTQRKSINIDEIANNIRKFLERVKNLCLTYQMATRTEKRELVKITSSNRFVSERNVVLAPRKWLQAVDAAVPFLYGAPPPATSRRRTELRNEQLEALVKFVIADDAQTIEAVFSGNGG